MPSQATPLLSQFSSETAGIVAEAAASAVSIPSKERACTGFFWRPDVVVTASDALDADGEAEFEVEGKSGPLKVRLAGRDPSTDIAILRTDGASGQAIALQAGANVGAGQVAIVVGRSEHGVSCAVGFVTLAGGPWESMRGGRIDHRIRLGLRLEPHQEGGPVLDAAGQCIGMAVLGPRRRTLVIPAATVERVASELLAHGRIRRGYLGVAGQPIRLQAPGTAQGGEPQAGLLVLGLDAGGPAQRAGILQGDIIVALDGKGIGSPRQLMRVLGPETAGRSLSCDLVRAGKPQTLSITIGERPAR